MKGNGVKNGMGGGRGEYAVGGMKGVGEMDWMEMIRLCGLDRNWN